MRISSHTIRAFLFGGVILAVLAAAYARTLAPGITWANNGADSGDLVTAAATLGIAHPTGYPTYLLLAHAFQLLPAGDLALRTTIMSAVAALITVMLIYWIMLMLLGDASWRTTAAAGTAALALGLSQVFWSQAVIAEVYSLNALFVALLLLFALQALRRPAQVGWVGLAQGMAAGVALGNHITVGLVVAAWLLATLIGAPEDLRARAALRCALGIAIGLCVYVYLPLRAAAHPPINWGDPSSLDGIWWTVSGQPYRDLAFGLPSNLLSERVAAWAALLVRQFGAPGLALGCYGLVYGMPRAPRFVCMTVGVALAASIFAVAYNSADSYAYLLPAYLIFALWIGLGIDQVLGAVARWRPAFAAAVSVALLGLLVWPAPATARAVDASGDRRAIEYAAGVLAAAPAHAIVLSTSDRDTFPLWYEHYALGHRPDLVVIVEPLLDFDWYRENLRAVYPALRIPEQPATSWAAALLAENGASARLCRTNLAAASPLACE